MKPFLHHRTRRVTPILSLSTPQHVHTASESPVQCPQQMRQALATVLELIAAIHAERKAKLDVGRADTVIQMGDRVLSQTDLGKLRPLWDAGDGPFTPPARPSPRSYTLALPRRMSCSATANVSRPKPFERSGPGAGAGGPGLLSQPGTGGRTRGRAACRLRVRGIMSYLVQWRGRLTTSGGGQGWPSRRGARGARGAQNSPRREARGPS